MNIKNSILFIIGLAVIGGVLYWQQFIAPPATKGEHVVIGIARWGGDSEYTRNVQGFKDGLEENGYVEGENVTFIIENPEADLGKQRTLIESFVAQEVDLIFSITTPGTLVAKDITGDIPIVFSVNTFPVESGVIESLEYSGNNLVGTRNYIPVDRQYAAFEKIYPYTRTLAFVHRKGEPNSTVQYNEMRALLEKKDIATIDIAAVDLADMRTQLESSIAAVDSFFSACDTLVQSPGGEELIVEFSKRYKKPSFSCNKGGIFRGHLMGNTADFYGIGKISGRQASLILRGAEPSSLLTESPGEDYILVNTRTAAEIGITLSSDIIDNANEIIE